MAAPPSDSDAWLTQRFRAYYRAHPPGTPERFGRREFAFLFFGQKFMLRHLGFSRREDFEGLLAERGPSHAYYSTAFYKDPQAPTMAEKGWLGAELIFDLDADHVPGAEKLPFPQQLIRVKEHFLRLVNEFIRGDFGFSEKELLLTFSGGRGYHCHVLNERALELSSQERREIVDFITGTGLDAGRFLREEVVGTRGRNSPFERAVTRLRVSAETDPAWGGRLNRALVRYLAKLKEAPDETILQTVRALPGIGAKRADQALLDLRALDLDRVRQTYLDQSDILRKLVPTVLANEIIPLAKGETDEPVTSDTKRLIRLPGSLHGKSGLKVVALRLDEVEAFDPLVEAVAFGTEPVRLNVAKPIEIPLAGNSIRLDPGPATVPESHAVYAVARGAAAPA